MGLLSYLRGTDIIDSSNGKHEDRALTSGNVPASMLPYSRSALLNVNTANALRVANAYACVRVLADSLASLPLKVTAVPLRAGCRREATPGRSSCSSGPLRVQPQPT